MKKALLTLIVISVATIASFAQFIGIGARGGLNFANVTVNNNGSPGTAFSPEAKTGYQLAGIVEFGFNKFFSVVPEIIYSSQGFNLQSAGIQYKTTLNYIQVPVLARLSLNLQRGRIFINAGPQLGLKTSLTTDLPGGGSIGGVSSSDFKSTDFGVVLGGGAGLDIGPGSVFTDIRYTLGLTNINTNNSLGDMKSGVFTISLGYMFKFGL